MVNVQPNDIKCYKKSTSQPDVTRDIGFAFNGALLRRREPTRGKRVKAARPPAFSERTRASICCAFSCDDLSNCAFAAVLGPSNLILARPRADEVTHVISAFASNHCDKGAFSWGLLSSPRGLSCWNLDRETRHFECVGLQEAYKLAERY